ncbi:DUF924 family protein [Granulosicoccus sp. 3-233]|uniref:DUF924 family protein n=1 Tax=Granulosicoccus sp. 3-233 TaxID=3417969 RepID=UPI003D33C1DB
MKEPTAEDIVEYWFRDEATGRMDLPQSKRWFQGGSKLDRELAERFGSTLALARAGSLDHWRESPTGTLALIILLDQFNRNINRGTAEAFAGDAQALSLCHHAIDRNYPAGWPLTHQVFCYMPLEHDESVSSQERSVALFTELLEKAPPELQSYAKGTLDYALQHKEIIDRFGRYPYRNAVLEREDTAEEREWLADGKRFGQ